MFCYKNKRINNHYYIVVENIIIQYFKTKPNLKSEYLLGYICKLGLL